MVAISVGRKLSIEYTDPACSSSVGIELEVIGRGIIMGRLKFLLMICINFSRSASSSDFLSATRTPFASIASLSRLSFSPLASPISPYCRLMKHENVFLCNRPGCPEVLHSYARRRYLSKYVSSQQFIFLLTNGLLDLHIFQWIDRFSVTHLEGQTCQYWVDFRKLTT